MGKKPNFTLHTSFFQQHLTLFVELQKADKQRKPALRQEAILDKKKIFKLS